MATGTCGSLAKGSIGGGGGGTLSGSRLGTAVTQLTFLTGRRIVVVVLIFVDAARIFRPSVVSGSGRKGNCMFSKNGP